MKISTKSVLGFTLIELMITITILAVLALAAFVSFSKANMRARDGKRKADLEQVRGALELYRTSIGSYPPSSSWGVLMETLTDTDDQYLSSSVADPKSNGNYMYVYTTPATPHAYSVCTAFETGVQAGDQPGLTCNGTRCCLYNP